MALPVPSQGTALGKASFHALRTLRRYSPAFFISPASVMASGEAAALRAAVRPVRLVVLNAPVTRKSIAVGRPGSSPGAAGGGNTRASAGRWLVPNRRPLASPPAVLALCCAPSSRTARAGREDVRERSVSTLQLLRGGLVRPGGRCVSVDFVAHLLSGPKVGILCTHSSFTCCRSATALMALSMSKV